MAHFSQDGVCVCVCVCVSDLEKGKGIFVHAAIYHTLLSEL